VREGFFRGVRIEYDRPVRDDDRGTADDGWPRAAATGLLVAAMGYLGLLAVVTRGGTATWREIAPLRETISGGTGWAVAAAAGCVGALVAAAGGRRTDERAPALASAALVAVGLAAFADPLGRHVAMIALSAALAFVASRFAPARRVGGISVGRLDRVLPVAGFVLTLVPMCIFAMHRHWAFGSGSWDMGCYVHNAYLVSRFLPTISTVLGGADFIGDHFSVGLYLYAPYFRWFGSAYGLIFLEALHLAVATPAVYGIARRHGASPGPALTLGLATGLSFGFQSASFFDVHAITLGFGFFSLALWAIEAGLLGWASVLLFAFSLFKESVGLYIVGLGLWLVVRAVGTVDRARRRRCIGFGAAWIAGGAAWFVVVNRLIMPWFRARGSAPEYHETFADFGPTVFEAARTMLAEPLTTFAFLFVGDEKIMSLFATLSNAAWLTVSAPSVFVAALPLFAERFLSSKPSMWHMGFHYAAPLALYAGWGAARGLGRIERGLGSWRWVAAPRTGVVVFVAAMAAFTLAAGYRHPANFLKWRYAYYSSPPKRQANAAAVRWLDQHAPRGHVAAQNRLLPHLARRRVIRRLAEYERTDWVVLSLGEDAWPYDRGFPRRLDAKLAAAPVWSRVFDERGTRIYRRLEAP